MLNLDAFTKRQFRAAICDTGRSGTSTCAKHADGDFQAYAEKQRALDGPVTARLPVLGRLDEMAQDLAWRLPRLDRKFITTTFRYLLAHSNSTLSAIESQLLQALAIDLLSEDCGAELQAYEEFCLLRAGATGAPHSEIQTRQDWLRYKQRDAAARG